MVEYHPISAQDLSRLHQFGPKVLPGIFLGYVLHADGIWKGDIMVADIEELEQMYASEIYAKRLNAKEVLTPMSGEKLKFPIADGTVKLSGGDQVLRTSTSVRDRPDRGEEQGNLRGESDGSSSTPPRNSLWYDGEVKNDFWSISVNFIYRHHAELKLYVPREQSFPIPLQYIDVTRTPDTSLNVMLEKISMTVGTLMEIENCQICGQFSQDSLSRDLERYVRCVGGIYIIDPDDEEFKDTMKNALRKLEVPMPAAMPCKLQREKYRETCRVDECKTKYACIVEADESMRKRMEGSPYNNHEDHIAREG